MLHPSLIPCCGADPLDPSSTTLTTASQLYLCEESRLAVLQIRSGLLPGQVGLLLLLLILLLLLTGQGAKFLEDLVAWAKERGVARLVCLASSHSHER